MVASVNLSVYVSELSGLNLALRSKVGVNVMGQRQISGVQRSTLGDWFCRVQQRALKSHYQSKKFVSVSVTYGRMQIIVQMHSTHF